MAKLKVGLAPYRSSFYDKKTNTYITLDNPVKEIVYDDKTDLSGICHACNGKFPALVLYEGKFPKATLDEWKSKYKFIAKQAINRADKNQEKSADNEEKESGQQEDPKEPEEQTEDPEDGSGDDLGQLSMASLKDEKGEAKKTTKTAKKKTAKKTTTKKVSKKEEK